MAQVTDPVCNMAIDSLNAASKTSYQGQSYYFCSDHCASRFQASPRRYARTEVPSSQARPESDRRLDGR